MSIPSVQGPPWLVLRADAPATAAGVLQLDLAPAGRALPVFLSEEVLARFVQELGWDGLTGGQMESVPAFVELVRHLQANGTTHIDFDPDLRQPAPIPIGEVVEHLGRQTG